MSVDNAGGEKRIHLMGHSVLDRLAYRHLLSAELRQEIEVESGFTPTAVWTAMRSKPDVVLVEADVPTSEVTDALQMVARLRPEARILIISAAVEPALVESWGRCPMHGYVVKDGGLAEFREAVAAIVDGESYYSVGTRPALERGASRANGRAQLSRRESELLPLLARGLTLREAACRMAISYKTADSYRTSLLRKLDVHDRVGLARYAIRKRIIEP
jgi:DNA-binding NarL/FixJ family response regulator